MATRKSARFTGGKLPERIDEIEAQVKSKLARDNRAVREAKYADTPCKFTIFDLIPELRERIYLYVLDTETPHKINALKAPTLALASKQVRAEVLPLFFTRCHFIVDVLSNYPHITRLDNLPDQGRARPRVGERADGQLKRTLEGSARSEYLRCGHIRATSWLSKLEVKEGIVPVFRHFELRIVYGNWGRPARWAQVTWMGVDVFPSSTRGLRPVITYDTREGNTKFPRELELVRGRAKAKLEWFAVERQVFPGFTVRDLEDVAKGFAYWPE
ncbi:hypothetical protein LTR56_000853 [Elasticomyces elasticus]|nr:hypothetical protein LTR22_018620 [Elasticomyces elasticus]KAK3660477.1 hypothetical protein LTR56_000853 [Elasticomyces elasticus]KAK4912279.1 hypothetical protein LTR49_019280 [Elasticomyces elasticus]KAK5751787.1 hypothetical protein LTS12_018115 [Elasticomyces elasticus]